MIINWKVNPALLFTPANKPERFSKAEEIGANAIIIDLEDAIALQDKDAARKIAFNYLYKQSRSKTLKLLRINNLSTPAGLADLLALTTTKIYFDALVYPKAESEFEINLINDLLETQYPQLPILAFIETGVGLSRADQIVQNSRNLAALLFGAADYAADIGCKVDVHAESFARQKVVQAAALKQLACFDSPYFDFHNEAGLINEINDIKSLGFNGKMAIHPSQIAPIKQAFKPSEQEYKDAQAIIATYDAAKGAACQYQGKMIDVPVYRRAKQAVELYCQGGRVINDKSNCSLGEAKP